MARYTAYYWDVRGRQRSAGTFARRREADRAWRRAEARIADGRFVSVTSGRQRFARYVTEVWLPNHVMEANTRQGYVAVLEQHLLPAFGTMRLNEILPGQVREFVHKKQVEGLSANTLARCRTVLGAIFTTAINDQLIYVHPCIGVAVPVAPKRPLRILTPGELAALLAGLPQARWRLLVELAIETGLRWGELTELRAGDVHLSSRTVTVARSVVELHGRHRGANGRFVIKAYPKSAEYRQLRLGGGLAASLAEHIKRHGLGPNELLFAYSAERSRDDHRAQGPQTGRGVDGHGRCGRYNAGCRCCWCRGAYADYRRRRRAAGKDRPATGRVRDTDGHLPRDWFRRQVWYPALRRAGLAGVRVHDLRHTNASWMLAGGADVQTVRERLGHRSLRATERYLHTLPDAGDAAIAAVHRIRGAATDSVEGVGDGQMTVTVAPSEGLRPGTTPVETSHIEPAPGAGATVK